MPLRFYVDFNTMMQSEDELVTIGSIGHPYHDQELLKSLCPGMLVVLYDEELEVEAIAEFDEDYQRWLGKLDVSTRRYLATPVSDTGLQAFVEGRNSLL